MIDYGVNHLSIPGDIGLTDLKLFPFIALSLFPIEHVEGGIFSRITMTGMTSSWYLRLSHFEAIFVGLVVLQVFVMRYFLILPLDLTKLIEDGTLLATSVSRKKRRAYTGINSKMVQQLRLAESMITILRRLDKDDCFVRTLCELERDGSNEIGYHGKVQDLLSSLKRLGKRRIKLENDTPQNNITIMERKVIAEFEEAVLLGSGYLKDSDTCVKVPGNENPCAMQYSLCDAEKNELLGYVKNIIPYLS